jgi:Ca2+-binding EF-hand superfamily protein
MNKVLWSVALAGALLTIGGLSAAPEGSKKADQAFAALDTNRDAKLSPDEFDRLFDMEGKTNVSAQEKREEFKSWDGNGDGAISKEEFAAKYGR